MKINNIEIRNISRINHLQTSGLSDTSDVEVSRRLEWIDIAKGIGIILVVVGHAGRGLSGAELPDRNGFLPLMDQTIYAFHMPLFFMLSGITFGMRPPNSIQASLVKRPQRLVYTLIIWTYAFLAMQALAGSSSNSGGSWQNILQAPLPPFAHFWFLWALLINSVTFAVLRIAFRPILSEIKFWSSAIIASGAINFVVDLPQQIVPWFALALNYSLVFAIGGLIGASPLVRAVPSVKIALLGSFLFISSLLMILSINPPINQTISGIFISIFLIIPVISISNRFGKSPAGRALAFLGIISLAVYVMHTMFSAVMRIFLMKAGYTDLTVHLVLGVLIGITGPFIFYLAARRLNILRVTGLA